MLEVKSLDKEISVKKIDNETVNLQIIGNEMLMSIVGEFDQNLKDLAKLTSTNIFFRGNSITCKGKKENTDLFCKAIKFLINKYFLDFLLINLFILATIILYKGLSYNNSSLNSLSISKKVLSSIFI